MSSSLSPFGSVCSVASLANEGGWLSAPVSPDLRYSPDLNVAASRTQRPYRYLRNCTSFSRADVKHLEEMIDNARDVTYATFFRHCSWREACALFGCYGHYKQGLTLKQDWAVSYHRSKYKGRRCYYLRHSAIEYIFCQAR